MTATAVCLTLGSEADFSLALCVCSQAVQGNSAVDHGFFQGDTGQTALETARIQLGNPVVIQTL